MMQRAVLAMLAQYKRWISPMLPPACRYVPSCSDYAAEAVARHGVLRGLAMATWRLLRCHPFVKGGYDPVAPVRLKHHDIRSHHHPAELQSRELTTENSI